MRPETPFLAQVRQDFQNVLENIEEFGRICTWNGTPLQIVEGANLEQQRPEGVAVNADLKLIVCRDIDSQPPPVPGDEVMFDGEPWRVVEVRQPFAHYQITLERITA